jgi:hypothetical protein
MSILGNYEQDRKQAVGLAGNVSAMANQREQTGKQMRQQAKDQKRAGLMTTAGTAASLYGIAASGLAKGASSSAVLGAIPGVGWAALGVMALGSLF